jgi:hypothetical protein
MSLFLFVLYKQEKLSQTEPKELEFNAIHTETHRPSPVVQDSVQVNESFYVRLELRDAEADCMEVKSMWHEKYGVDHGVEN